MHACTPAETQSLSFLDVGLTMAQWSMMDREWPPDGSYDPYSYGMDDFFEEQQDMPPLAEYFPPHAQHYNNEQNYVQQPAPPSPALIMLLSPAPPPQPLQPPASIYPEYAAPTVVVPRGENPREIRNKAEKQRRDKLNHSISELASMVPPVVASNKKIDKTGVLRLTAHYLRAYQYVFGEAIGQAGRTFSAAAAQALLSLLGGFLLTTTYKGLVVVVSQNIQQYLGYSELDLLGQNIFNYIHPEDHQALKDNLMPNTHLLGPHGELLIPDEPDGKSKIAAALAAEKIRIMVRFKKHSQRSEPATYVACCVEGTLRKSDRACRVSSRCCQVVRRARARGDNPCSSGNDVVFIGVVRPTAETFVTEKRIEAFRMEYRTRHSVDGEIMDCEQRISLVAGYMTHEVNGVNAMNFIHRDDVRWVIFALRDMYDQHLLVGESCYRLLAKSGQFIYMKTRGALDVDKDSRAVRSFVCTNTVVDEEEGTHLIKMMKKRCMMKIKNRKTPPPEIEEIKREEEIISESKVSEDKTLPVHDLERVILHLVNNLPSPKPDNSRSSSPDKEESPALPLAIIPPQTERILSAIERIYCVIKTAGHREQEETMYSNKIYKTRDSRSNSPSKSPVRACIAEQNHRKIMQRQKLGSLLSLSSEPGYSRLVKSSDNSSAIVLGLRNHMATSTVPKITYEQEYPYKEDTAMSFNRNETQEMGTKRLLLYQGSRKRTQSQIGNINKKVYVVEKPCSSVGEGTSSEAVSDMVPVEDPFADFDMSNFDLADVSLENIEEALNLPWMEDTPE